MKILKNLFLISAGLCMLHSCSEIEDVTPNQSPSTAEDIDWVQLLSHVDPLSNILLVSNGESIQEAINAAPDYSDIYIEPGEYNESIILDKSGVRLFSVGLRPEDKVVINNPKVVSIVPYSISSFKNGRSAITVNREDLGGDVAHYTFDLKMSTSAYDLIRIHRVVKEKQPYRPGHANGDVFMVHGAIQDFDDIFLSAGALDVNENTSAPYYLAVNGVDVWGIDLAWNRVPMTPVEGFDFMKDWGVEKDIDHVLKSMALARLIRGMTQQGYSKLNLLGFSYGVHVVYGAAGRETQQHKRCRDIKGLIPVDSQLKTDNPKTIEADCGAAKTHLDSLVKGIYNNPWGVDFIGLGQIVLADPNGHFFTPYLTNIQIINDVASSHAAGWHFLGGNPFALTYTDSMRLPRMAVNLAPHQPRLQFYEMAACGCPDFDISYDDNLHRIKLPILHISAEGSDNSKDYTASLTGTKDYERLHISDPNPNVLPEVNFGHADLWMSHMAPKWVWQPLYQWLLNH